MTPERHVESFGVKDGQLVVGGMRIEQLAASVGSTPFFAYDRRLLSARVESLRAALPAGLHLGYAVKANPMPAVVQHLAGLVDALDVASAGEMRLALDTGKDPAAISFAGPGKTEAELRQAVASGVVVEVESPGEAERLLAAGDAVGVRPVVAIRVNPDFAVQGSGMRMGGGPQQFGVDAEAVPELVADLVDRDVDLIGFHVFAGSQNLDVDLLAQAQVHTVDLVLRLADLVPAPLRYVNLGGGFGIPYFEKDQPIDLHRLGANLGDLLETRLRPALPQARTVVELGRYVVGECGVYVTRVVDTKVSRGQRFAVVDGGMHHQLAASGNLGQVIRRNYPLVVGNRLDADDLPSGEVDPVTVVGSLCTPLDLMGSKLPLPQVEVGDLVVIFQAGAYGLTASPTAFLGHPYPAEVLV